MQQSHQPKAETRAIEIPNAILIPQIIKYLEQGHTVTLPLKGYSMRPFLENNRDMALLTSPRNIRVGAPVLAEIAPTRYVLH
ncbi:MAG: peptidase S41, partial [Prevotella sp.]